jgi:ethanolamine utilization protein EutQ (cupin superfamily)
MSDKNLSYIAFYDEYNKVIDGYFEILINNGILIKFKTSAGNIITLPYSRLLKIKEKGDEK